jgi:hypothetical protein
MRRLVPLATLAAVLAASACGCGCQGELQGGEHGRAPQPSAPAELDPARDAYEEGLRHYRKARPGARAEKRELSEAAKSFRRCLKLLEELRKTHPHDPRITRLQVGATRCLCACMRQRTL